MITPSSVSRERSLFARNAPRAMPALSRALICGYSYRNDSTGSSRDARIAG